MQKLLFLGFALFALAVPSFADTVDFRDVAFRPVKYRHTYSVTRDGVEMTLSAGPAGARLFWQGRDGIGVKYSWPIDQIEGRESFTIRFSEPVIIEDFFVTDLYNQGFLERGYYSIDGGERVSFVADPDQRVFRSNGELTVPVGTLAETITFTAGRFGHEFSVGGISFHPNPEPGTLTLFGAVAAGAAIRRRRRRKRAAAA